MGVTARDLSKIGFAKTFILPGLLIFLVPVISLCFFLHAQNSYDSDMRKAVLRAISKDASLTPEQRNKATAFFTEHPYSQLIKNKEFAADLDSRAKFDYATFRWAIRLSAASIVGGFAVFVLGGICVLLSRHSQQAQYLSLTIGWQVLRIYGAAQAIIQGALLVALSFWITALWFHVYIVKLIFLVGVLALVGVAAVVKGIFKKPDMTTQVDGKVITRGDAPALWNDLNTICTKVGAELPDQVIVGIDDNFFVTEMPVNVDGTTCHGRTLYVSLSLLKQMCGAEADSVLAHEMAHFSGNDTLYSKKISPLLSRYGLYLQALYEGPVTRPIYYFMNCFRALFELSLGKHSRQREFRADKIATETTSPGDFAGAMLRISAYSDFRGNIQQELFKQERALQTANISAQIEQGFHAYAMSFATKPDIGSLETAHPFDTHPPLSQRLEAVGIPLKSHDVQSLVSSPGDGRWYYKIDHAEQIERQQWSEFEERFRAIHEETLAYRFLPETDEEREIVVKAFPELTIDGKKGSLVLNHESIKYTDWPQSIHFGLIINFALKDNGTLDIQYNPGAKLKKSIPMKTFASRQQEALEAINRYYGRYMSAVAYQKQKQSIGK
jgi:Zn-dependent protease with chaperone function